MVVTYSAMLPLGTKLPEFDLLDTIISKKFNSDDLSINKGKVVMFICNHCPFVIHYYSKILELANEYLKADIEFVAISSNDAANYPEDSPQKMKELAKELQFPFPYLYDETQEVAKKYKAECTPEFYLFDKKNILIYRGRLDDSTPNNNKEITGKDLRSAIDNFLDDSRDPIKEQYPSMGCNIKWK